MSTPVTLGRVVHYKLSSHDAEAINRRRVGNVGGGWPLGAQAHMGNSVKAGDVFPMIVVAVWSDELCNGQVLLDGNDTLWKTSVSKGEAEGFWDWMPFQKDQQARLADGTKNDSHPEPKAE